MRLSEKVAAMLTRLFRGYGQLCASRPWEVIVCTITLTAFVMSMSLFAMNNRICGWNYECEQQTDDTKSSDIIILTLARCAAVIYFYLQFSSLRSLGSKYLLGIAGLFTVFSSFVFSIGVINIFGSDLTGLNEALPFFLLLVDLSKACSLAKFALSATTQDKVIENIGRGMALLGPTLTLDTFVETLVIGIGTVSGVKVLETMCCFGCLSVIINYLAFMTFYPACLALILELSRGSRPLLQIQKLAKVWEENAEEEKPNPVTQRVKIIMSAGLVFFHAHSRLFVTNDADIEETVAGSATHHVLPPELSQILVPDISLWHFYLKQMTSLSVDYILTLSLAAILAIKYIFFDCDPELLHVPSKTSTTVSSLEPTTDDVREVAESELETHPVNDELESVNGLETASSDAPAITESKTDGVCHVEPVKLEADSVMPETVSVEVQTDRSRVKSALFFVGDSSEDSDDSEGETETVSVETQTEDLTNCSVVQPVRPLDQCVAILKSVDGASQLTDEEIVMLVDSKKIATYQLETVLGDYQRGVNIRRSLLAKSLPGVSAIEKVPCANYDYKYVYGSCCENVVGYVPIPLGTVGPLLLDGKQYMVPMATTEGCLVASTNRGCRALMLAGGIKSVITKDGMTRAPVVRFGCVTRANEARVWLEDKDNYQLLEEAFNGTSRFARVQSIAIKQLGRSLHLRFTAFTGDAMGMNMVSKGCEKALNILKDRFPDMEMLSLSGNFCTDKKPSAVNWVEGRGKSVICDAVVPANVVKDILKTSAAALADLNIEKNFIGSAAAGSIGGFNAHTANVVAAIYIATGQDPAQVVCSSNCMTIMQATGPTGDDLYVSCSMPCIEVGTVGGGTILPPQAACLEVLGVLGSNPEDPGANARTLARVICATAMAAELSLMSALTTGDLVRSHLKHNRSVLNMAPTPIASYNSVLLPSSSTADCTPRVPSVGSCLKS